MKPSQSKTVFLFRDVDNDRVIADLQVHLEGKVGLECAQHYWCTFEKLRDEMGYAAYLGARQRYRGEYPRDPAVFTIGRYLLDYPCSERLFPSALEVIEHLKQWGPAAILIDGDVVFQPRKFDQSRLFDVVAGRIFIYRHKERELADVVRRWPAEHCVLVENKLRIITAVKNSWRSRVTTVFVRQGHYAHDPKTLEECPTAGISIDCIGDLLQYQSSSFLWQRR